MGTNLTPPASNVTTLSGPATINTVLLVGQGPSGPTGATGPTSPAAGSDKQVQYNSGGAFAGSANFTYDAVTNVLALAPGASLSLGYKASGANASQLIFQPDLVTYPAATSVGLSIDASGSAVKVVAQNGTTGMVLRPSALDLASNGAIRWTNGSNNPLTTIDLALERGGAGILEQRNGANAQAFRLYSSYVSASDYSRLGFAFSAGPSRWEIAPANAGTGVQASLYLSAPAGASLAIGSSIQVVGAAAFSSTVKAGSFTVATLPSAATSGAGAIAYVTDATANTYDAILVGGGAIKIGARSDGTNWRAF